MSDEEVFIPLGQERAPPKPRQRDTGPLMRIAEDIGVRPEDAARPIAEAAKSVRDDIRAGPKLKDPLGLKSLGDVANLGLSTAAAPWNAFVGGPAGRVLGEIPTYEVKGGKGDARLAVKPREQRNAEAEGNLNTAALLADPLLRGGGAPRVPKGLDLSGLMGGKARPRMAPKPSVAPRIPPKPKAGLNLGGLFGGKQPGLDLSGLFGHNKPPGGGMDLSQLLGRAKPEPAPAPRPAPAAAAPQPPPPAPEEESLWTPEREAKWQADMQRAHAPPAPAPAPAPAPYTPAPKFTLDEEPPAPAPEPPKALEKPTNEVLAKQQVAATQPKPKKPAAPKAPKVKPAAPPPAPEPAPEPQDPHAEKRAALQAEHDREHAEYQRLSDAGAYAWGDYDKLNKQAMGHAGNFDSSKVTPEMKSAADKANALYEREQAALKRRNALKGEMANLGKPQAKKEPRGGLAMMKSALSEDGPLEKAQGAVSGAHDGKQSHTEALEAIGKAYKAGKLELGPALIQADRLDVTAGDIRKALDLNDKMTGPRAPSNEELVKQAGEFGDQVDRFAARAPERKKLETMPAAKLKAELQKRMDALSAMNTKFLARGWDYRPSEIRDFAKKEPTTERGKLAAEWAKLQDALGEAIDEHDARKRYHGGEGPIRRKE